MPQAVLLAAIPAAAAVGGAVIQSRASGKATKAQQAANTEALNFTKAQAELAAADYERRYNTWLAERNALMSRYGISLPSPAPIARPAADAAPPLVGRPGAQRRPAVALVRGRTVADMLGLREGAAPAEWDDWRGYGLRTA